MAGYTFQKQQYFNFITGTSLVFNYSPVSAGNLLLCYINQGTFTTLPTSVVDSASTALTNIGGLQQVGSTRYCFYHLPSCGATSSITVNYSSSTSAFLAVIEYSFGAPGYKLQSGYGTTGIGLDKGAVTSNPGIGLLPTYTTPAVTAPALVVCAYVGSNGSDNNMKLGNVSDVTYRGIAQTVPCGVWGDTEVTGTSANTVTYNANFTSGGTNSYTPWSFVYSESTAVIQSKQGSVGSSAATLTATFAATTAAGSTIVVCAPIKASTSSAILSVTDDKGNTYLGAIGTTYIAQGSQFGKSAIFYCLNPVAGVSVVTLNTSTGTLFGSITAIELIGQAVFDQASAITQASGSSINRVNGTVDAGANDVVIACFQQQGTTTNDGPSVDSSYTALSQTNDGTTNCNMVAVRQNTVVNTDAVTFSWTGGAAPATVALASFYNPLPGFLVRPAITIPLEDVIYY
jgi:hypothetical protein